MTSRHYIATASIAVVLCTAALFGVFGSALRQGDDNVKVFSAILMLPFSSDGFARVDDTTLIAWSKGAVPALKRSMESRGWQYREQMGSGYFFEKGEQHTTITTHQFSRSFTMFGMASAD